MAWEQRGNHLYYYHKRREGDRVVSEYWGRVPFVDAMVDKMELMKSTERQIPDNDLSQAEQALDDLSELLRKATRGAYRAHGYHYHNGVWRRRRESA